MFFNKILRIFILLTSVLSFQSSFADGFRYSKIIIFKQDDKQNEVYGQEIGNYQQRWFWEPVSSASYYVGLFYFENMKPKINFINLADIRRNDTSLESKSLYHEFLKDNGLLLKQPPFKEWNYVSTGNDGHHLFENMSGNFAWDVVKKKKNNSFHNQGFSNQDYHVWAEPVYSPISGTVTEVVRSAEDNVPDPTNTADLSTKGDGNYILIHLYSNFYFILMHFKKDSIPPTLVPGSKLQVGDYIGEVGNSGVSYSPHLHMTMYYWSFELDRMISVPTLFEKYEVKRGSFETTLIEEVSIPKTGDLIKALH